jgi:hypothetical protein
MKMISSLSALALVAALAVPAGLTGALAQDKAAGAGQMEPCDLGADLSADALRAIEDQNERLHMLSCMIGTPRDYQAELSQRQPGGEIRAVNVEEIWGQDVVAEGLRQSAKANAAVTGDLQAAVEADEELSGFLKSQGYRSLGIIGYRINLADGSTDIFLAPLAGAETGGQAPQSGDGAESDPVGVENEEMAESMEKAVEEGTEEGSKGEGSSQ